MAEIRSFVTPTHLYRYRKVRDLERELQAIREGYLFCAALEGLNDPMEGLFASSQRVRNSENYQAFKAALIASKAQLGICSFSEVHNHELMWAHYADRFTGVCVEYNFSKLRTCLDDDVEFVRMFYDEKVPTIGQNFDPVVMLAKRVLSCKNYRWLYEREWRMFATQGKVTYGEVSCVTHVYLGSRITQEHRERVRTALQDAKITVSDMAIKKYSMNFVDI
jgi:hypothetical protein